MQINRTSEGLEMVLFLGEKNIFKHVIESIQKIYLSDPAALDELTRETFYSSFGFDSAELDEEERKDWVNSLHEIKSESVELCETLLQELRQAKEPVYIKLPMDQTDALLGMINDHRLFIAAQFAVDKIDMELDIDQFTDPDKRRAMSILHFLSWMIELILDVKEYGGGD